MTINTTKVSDLNETCGSLNTRMAFRAASRDLVISSRLMDPATRFLVATSTAEKRPSMCRMLDDFKRLAYAPISASNRVLVITRSAVVVDGERTPVDSSAEVITASVIETGKLGSRYS